jgi:hypothetical protein
MAGYIGASLCALRMASRHGDKTGDDGKNHQEDRDKICHG